MDNILIALIIGVVFPVLGVFVVYIQGRKETK